MTGVRVVIEGTVQGVAFRDWTRRQAEVLGVDGWVRNRRDGSVEAVFAGPEEAVARMLEACRVGPRMAEVRTVRIVSEDETTEAGFAIQPTL